jgi:hypothetical protein
MVCQAVCLIWSLLLVPTTAPQVVQTESPSRCRQVGRHVRSSRNALSSDMSVPTGVGAPPRDMGWCRIGRRGDTPSMVGPRSRSRRVPLTG